MTTVKSFIGLAPGCLQVKSNFDIHDKLFTIFSGLLQ